jgi:hypothetical protein
MKKLLLLSAIVALAACGEKPKTDMAPGETTGEMAPADTGMGMSHDTSMMMQSDTTMARDTAK